jgi:hypothetical protein
MLECSIGPQAAYAETIQEKREAQTKKPVPPRRQNGFPQEAVVSPL